MSFVNESGWTRESIGRGAEAVGYVSTVHGMFPHGAVHLIHHFTVNCNADLASKIKEVLF